MERFRRLMLAGACLLASLSGGLTPAGAQPKELISVELGSGFGEFLVVNRGPTASLQFDVTLEHRVGGAWKPVLLELQLLQSCSGRRAPRCIELGANATLRPLPFTGNFCTSQCTNYTCRGSQRMELSPGAYRFVIATCSGERKYASPPFEYPPR